LAGMFGVIAVFIFMMSYYRLPGLVASIALVLYTGIVFAILTMFDATLTLTGIAGLILGIGMAVDANVLIFERMKEELRNKSLPMALRLGFDRAWTAIFDSNMTGLLSASVLWVMGTGSIRGFAVTLIISILSSMFTAIYVSRVLMEVVIATRFGAYAKLFLGARPESVLREEPRRGGRPLR
jgi:protein-export membrane protein SecD